LVRAVAAGAIVASTDPAIVGTGAHVIVVIGTRWAKTSSQTSPPSRTRCRTARRTSPPARS
jgi:hypothetical protein